jgi:hypothetical protein
MAMRENVWMAIFSWAAFRRFQNVVKPIEHGFKGQRFVVGNCSAVGYPAFMSITAGVYLSGQRRRSTLTNV